MISLFFAGLLLGLAGSLHCMGMCGPLVISVPFEQSNNKLVSQFVYFLGKTITYAALGLLLGGLGKGFLLLEWQQVLSILSGIVLLAITLLPYIKSKLSLNTSINKLFAWFYNLKLSNKSVSYYLMFGLLNGLLPCGLVYAALSVALVSSSSWHGMLFMAAFGIGTVPALASIVFLRSKALHKWRTVFTRSSFYISVFIGVLLIVRGLGLGIPYVSPKLNQDTHKVDCCHRP